MNGFSHGIKGHHTEQHVKTGGSLREAVFGYNDGVVSTFAVIAGMAGGFVDNRTVLLAALITLIAGAFSMGLGTYPGNKSELDIFKNETAREKWEMENLPDIETQEIRDIFAAKGFKGKLLEDVVKVIISDKKVWLDTMLREELGFAEAPPSPAKHGIVMSASFSIGSFIPTIPFFFKGDTEHLFQITIALSIAALLAAGILKTKFTQKNIFLSALETLLIGAVAAAGSYWLGTLIRA